MSALRTGAAAGGLGVADVGAFDIGGRPAIYATVVTGDPSGFARGGDAALYTLEQAAHDDPAAAAGMYVGVRDAAGVVVYTGGTATRLQQGVGWRNPALAPDAADTIR